MLGPTSLGHRRVHELKGSPFFACVRNPYDRAVSAYWFIRQTQARVAFNMAKTWKDVNEFWISFEKENKSPFGRLVANQIDFIREVKGTGGISPRIETVLRYETLAEDWPAFALLHDLPPLPHKNKSELRPATPWQEQLSDESISKIGELYAEDFETLNYERLV
jgi:hypothetical protein